MNQESGIQNRESRIENKERAKIKSFTDLEAWREGHKLVMAIYKITKKLPKEELFCLVSQMRRAAISITSNIAEGFSRQSFKEKIQFYFIAQSSLTELQNQLIVTKDAKYITREEFYSIAAQTVKTHKLLSGLIKKTRFFSTRPILNSRIGN